MRHTFPKGNSLGGRPKGAVSKRTKQWEELGESIMTRHTERFNEILLKADDETFVKHFTNIIEYFQPKLQRSDVSQESVSETTIRIVRDSNPPQSTTSGTTTDIA